MFYVCMQYVWLYVHKHTRDFFASVRRDIPRPCVHTVDKKGAVMRSRYLGSYLARAWLGSSTELSYSVSFSCDHSIVYIDRV